MHNQGLAGESFVVGPKQRGVWSPRTDRATSCSALRVPELSERYGILNSSSTGPLYQASPQSPPGPSNFLTSTVRFQRDPLRFVDRLISQYGDIAQFRLGSSPVVMLNHPNYVHRVLLGEAGTYERDSLPHRLVRSTFGDALFALIGGQSWLRRRRMLQPAFHRKQIAQLYDTIRNIVSTRIAEWEHHTAGSGPMDMGAEMTALTLDVTMRSLFSLALDPDTIARFTGAVGEANRELAAYVRSPFIPLAVPTVSHRRLRDSLRRIDEIVFSIVDRYVSADDDRADLLTMMIDAEDQDTGERMSRQELRDEVFGMMFAGHETSATTLTWIWYLLAKHPDIQEKTRDEVQNFLGDRLPEMEDLTKLTYIRAVIDETLRLYPPGWQGYRSARVEDVIDGYRIPAGTTVFYSIYHLHRHPSFWTEPELFRPERFLPINNERRHRGSYIPFGEGGHVCIGKPLAMLEMPLIVAMTLQRYRLVLATEDTIKPAPAVTLQTKSPVRMHLIQP
ncbi:cytochrome P450 [Nocardia sp. NPDC052278]|uniref:cytochrome P450 n=1 Tax=unclassified Nocardia TaxID=2637762 RepID=UPI0036C7357C